jgi:hypothetical protein
MGRTRREAEPSLPAPKGGSEAQRKPGLRAIGGAASRLAAPIVAKSGGGIAARIKVAWPEIVGTELAAITWPESLSAAGILRLRVVPPEALALQHRAPIVIDRVNAYFGRAIVSRIAIVQGPLPSRPQERPRRRTVSAHEADAIDRQIAGIGDSGLRAALAQLGRAIAATHAMRAERREELHAPSKTL